MECKCRVEIKEEIFDEIIKECINAYKENQLELSKMAERMMDIEGVPTHHPYHHFITSAVLLTAAAKKTGRDEDDLQAMLFEAKDRAKNVLPGFCGYYGACGAAVGAGIFMSVFTDTSPFSEETWQWANEITSLCLKRISEIPGPRCCKRTSFLALQTAAPYIEEKLDIDMELRDDIKCKYQDSNEECKKELCPFYQPDKQ